ncbi:MAG: hypothetical protein D6731_00780, partial [Planctomycetota bacterium]
MRLPAGLLERVASPPNLLAAWERIRRNDSAAGIDRVRAVDYAEGLEERLRDLGERLRTGRYQPRPGRSVNLASDPERPIVIFCLEDRLVQRAVAQILGPFYERELSENAWAYRPGRSVERALERVDEELRAGKRWFLRCDVAKFFDRIDRERLLSALRADGLEPGLLRVIDRLLRGGVLGGAATLDPGEGTPQGSALSPLLSNVYLRPLDAAFEGDSWGYARYADDVLVLSADEESLNAAHVLIAGALAELGLELNARKTRRGHLGQGFVFLGVRFGSGGRGHSERSHRALSARCAEHLRAGASAEEFRELLGAWERWYGPLPAEDVDRTPLLLAELETAVARDDLERAEALAERRVTVWCDGEPWPASVHARLVRAWSQIPGARSAEALVLDLLAFAHSRPSESERESVLEALWLPRDACLPHELEAAGQFFGEAGRATLADAARRLRSVRPRPKAEDAGLDAEAVTCLWRTLVRNAPEHAVEEKNGRGQRVLSLCARPPSERSLVRHVSGKERLGLCALTPDGRARLALIDVRVKRRAILPPWVDVGAGAREARPPGQHPEGHDPNLAQRWETLVGVAHDFAARLCETAERLGVPYLLEGTGRGGRRLWFPFREDVGVASAFALAARIRREAGAPPPTLAVISWPPSDRTPSRETSLLDLPCGVDARTGGRSRLLARSGRPLGAAASSALLQAWLDRAGLRDLLLGPRADLADRPGDQRQVERLLDGQPRAKRVLQGCAILRALVDKALRLGHLEPIERRSLLETFGHLPGEEAYAALELLEGLLETARSRHSLRRRLRNLPQNPISCPSLANRHGRLTQAPCACRFQGLEPGCYPTPLLYALGPGEVPVFRPHVRRGRRRRRRKRKRATERGSPTARRDPSSEHLSSPPSPPPGSEGTGGALREQPLRRERRTPRPEEDGAVARQWPYRPGVPPVLAPAEAAGGEAIACTPGALPQSEGQGKRASHGAGQSRGPGGKTGLPQERPEPRGPTQANPQAGEAAVAYRPAHAPAQGQ